MKRKRFSMMIFLVVMQFILCLLSGSVMATPLKWTLDGVTFDDGATASGFFIYDADTNTYSDWGIAITGSNSDSILPDFVYQPTNAYPNDPYLGEVEQPHNEWVDFYCRSALSYSPWGRYLQLYFGYNVDMTAYGLTNAGGTYNLTQAAYSSFEQNLTDSNARYITGGSVSTAPPSTVPEPATMFLFGTGLIGLAGFRRKCLKK